MLDLPDIDDPATPGLRPPGPLIRADAAGAWSEAADVLQAARDRARAIVERAEALCEAERARGYEEGLEAAASRTSVVLADIVFRAGSYLRQIEQALPSLVIEVVERMLGAFEPGELLPRCVARGLAELRRGGEAALRVEPGRVEEIRAVVAGLGEAGRLVDVHPDPTLPPGVCQFMSAFGVVELGVEAQLQTLRARLKPPGEG